MGDPHRQLDLGLGQRAPEVATQPTPAGPPRAPVVDAPKVLTLVDASGYIFRAFHALPGLTTSKGVPTNAVLGFTRMILKLLRDQNPPYVALCFDKDSRRGRLEIDPQYKANREAPAPELVAQFHLIRRVAHALNLPSLESPGWEADDVIATMVAKARSAGFKVRIVSSDKDLAQLVSDDVELFDPVSERALGPAAVEEKYGVRPAQLRDYQALIGDAIDNVPKVPGIGPKTAVELLRQFGDLDALVARLDQVKKPKIREAIASNLDGLARSRRLVSFRADLPVAVEVADLARRPPLDHEAKNLFAELEFFKLIQEMPRAPVPPLAADTPQVADEAGLTALAERIARAGVVALVPAFEGEGRARLLVGLAVAAGDGEAAYVPLAHAAGPNVAGALLRTTLGNILGSAQVRKQGHDLKALWHALDALGIELAGIEDDVELLSWLLNPARRAHGLADLSRERLQLELPPSPADARKHPLSSCDVRTVAAPFGAWADATRRLAPGLWEEVRSVGLEHVVRELELPLVPILSRMEKVGVKLDLAVLGEVAARVDKACQEHLAEVYRLAGREFNVGSPAQLAQVLFVDLKLPVLKRGKTGPSTDREVLEKLAEQHPLPKEISAYREVSKLKTTYLDTLPRQVDAAGRVHTTFHQAAVATGRLSSTDPNLQNIPVRAELGREIRRAFVAEEGWTLVSADYSQVELRILAHVTGDEGLIAAFADDADVHARTAAEVFGTSVEQVTSAQRRTAKMINYGIAYGLSAHGLSARLDIPVEEAQAVIDRYFQRYAGVRLYLEEIVAKAHRSGFVESVFGRRRYMPELGSSNRSVVMAAERAAINMPIQGTAADLAKRAMLRVDTAMRERKLSSRLLLQVHDELLFEAKGGEVEQVMELAEREMSGVADFRVPLKVDVRSAHSWAEAH